jgi:hypothetical protein
MRNTLVLANRTGITGIVRTIDQHKTNGIGRVRVVLFLHGIVSRPRKGDINHLDPFDGVSIAQHVPIGDTQPDVLARIDMGTVGVVPFVVPTN